MTESVITIIFSSSLFLTALLLVLKYLELRSGKSLGLSIISKLDPVATKIAETFSSLVLRIIEHFKHFVLVSIRATILEIFLKTREKALRKYQTHQNTIMGRKVIANRGSVSFYLRKINEVKNGHKGEIN